MEFQDIADRARHRLNGYNDGKPGTPEDIAELIARLDSDIRSYSAGNSALHGQLTKLQTEVQQTKKG